jgi:uncharacterized membrane protein
LARSDKSNEKVLGRIFAFSDGVVAIAILLLLIDIKLPADISTAGLGSALRSLWPNYLAFFISFVVIGLYWTAHVRLFREIISFDWVLVWLNMLFLLFIVIIPFATTVVSMHNSRLAIILYAVTITGAGYMNTILRIYSTVNHRLINDKLSVSHIKRGVLLSLVAPIGFTLSIGIVFINISAAQIFWILIAVTHIIFQRKLKS